MPESSEAAVAGRGYRAKRGGRMAGVAVPLAVLVVALLVFLWVLLIGTEYIFTGLEPGVNREDWALVGSVVLLVLLGVLVAYAMASRNRALDAQARARTPRASRGQVPPKRADELRVTAEEWRGLRVLEYSRPPKSEDRSALYTRCYVTVDPTYVLRLEDLIAKRRE